jgi:hypothetical protein
MGIPESIQPAQEYTSATWPRKAMDWTVFPNPISSARIPLIPLENKLASQVIP